MKLLRSHIHKLARWGLVLISIAALVLAALGGPLWATASPLFDVTNGGFETGAMSPWFKVGARQGEMGVLANNPHTGTYNWQIGDYWPGDMGGLCQDVTSVTSNDVEYVISVWGKLNSGGSGNQGRFYVIFSDGSTNLHDSYTLINDPNWNQFSDTYTWSGASTRQVCFEYYNNHTGATWGVDTYWDDFTLSTTATSTPTSTPTNTPTSTPTSTPTYPPAGYYAIHVGQFGSRSDAGGWAMYQLDLSGIDRANLQGLFVKYISATNAWGWTEMCQISGCIWPDTSAVLSFPNDWCIPMYGIADQTAACNAAQAAAGSGGYSLQASPYDLNGHIAVLKLSPWTSPPNTTVFATLDVWAIYYDAATVTPTPTATGTGNPTETAAAAGTSTAAAAATSAAAAATSTANAAATQAQGTAVAGATQTALVATNNPTDMAAASQTAGAPTPAFNYGNVIQNWDFNIAPLAPNGGSYWAVAGHVVQAPLASDPWPSSHMPKGSCGPKYWDMATGGPGDPGGSFWQQFDWQGGPMYINFEVESDTILNHGEVAITNLNSGAEFKVPIYIFPFFFKWTTIKIGPTPNFLPGPYRMTFWNDAPVGGSGMGVDNVNVRAGTWNQDCPADQYDGQMPVTNQGNATATASPEATATIPPLVPNKNILVNCDLENSWSGYAHNQATLLNPTGGAVGPTFAQLYTLMIPQALPPPLFIPGIMYQPFTWPGGRAYVSYFVQDGSSVIMRVRNLMAGTEFQQVPQVPVSSPTGWTRMGNSYDLSAPGQYLIEFDTPQGSSAGIDGITVAAGGYAEDSCSTASTASSNATQAAANATATAVGSATSAVATQTAAAVQTQANDTFATFAAIANATNTAAAASTQTQSAAQTETQAQNQIATESVRETATAQGTPMPSATHTPFPATATPIPPSTLVVPPATLTAVANNLSATETAQAAAYATALAAAQLTQAAAAFATQHAAQTETAVAAANATNQAAINATNAARATQTAAWATQAQATQNAAATQTALVLTGDANQIATATKQAAETQTQAAIDLATSNYIATQSAGATQTALALTNDYSKIATATAQAAQTATAAAVQTQNAQATTDALGTQTAHATGTAVAKATQTSLAATANATDQANATLTAVATTNAQATEGAQATVTAQAVITQQALGTAQATQTVEPRPEPGPAVDCVRPTNPLWLADWIDYEVCRVLTWFAWSPDNTQQVLSFQANLADYEPFGTASEILQAKDELSIQIGELDWAATGLRQDDPVPLVAVFFPSTVTPGLLTGQLLLTPGQPGSIPFVTICTLRVGDIFGDAIAKGVCAVINWTSDIGLMGWLQFLFDIVVWVAFMRYSWKLITVVLTAI